MPALQNPPLLTIHVGFAMLSYGIFAMSFAAGVGYLVQEKQLADGRTVDRFGWLPRVRSSTRSPTGRSSSASPSSPR